MIKMDLSNISLVMCFGILFITINSNSIQAQTDFITTWEITSANEEINIGTVGGSEITDFDFTIDWGDGTQESITGDDPDPTHTYSSTGIYTVTISGTFPSINFNGQGTPQAIRTVEQWGDIAWESLEFGFVFASDLTINASDAPNLSNVTSLRGMFVNSTNLSGNFSNWDVSNIQDLSQMFIGANNFNEDISSWNVSNVTNISAMFRGSGAESSFNGDLSSWDVSSVTNMSGMFVSSEFNQDISNWDVGNVTNMKSMFNGASNFNQDVSNWDVSSVTDMSGMFFSAQSFNGDLSNWDVSSVTDMSDMFRGATNFTDGGIGNWDVSSVTNMNLMFWFAQNFSADLGNWDVSKVSDMGGMFRNTASFGGGNIQNWDVGNVVDMSLMFSEAATFNVPLNNWDVSNVTNMDKMFYEAQAFNQNLNGWDVTNVGTMQGMFENASTFNGDISSWDISNVEVLVTIFSGATSFDQNLGTWDISKAAQNGFIESMLDNTNMSVINFDSTLIGWYDLGLTPNPIIEFDPFFTINFGGSGLEYCNSSYAVEYFSEELAWDISATKQPGCLTSVRVISPINNSLVAYPVHLKWITDSLSAEEQIKLELSTEETFTAQEKISSYTFNPDPDSLQLTNQDVLDGIDYYWRVRKEHISTQESSEWDYGSFKVKPEFFRLISDSVFVRTPNSVNIMLHATDRNNLGLDFLDKDSFELLEAGSPISPTESNYQVSKLEGIPFSLQTVLMLDNSLSIGESNLELIKDAASFFVENKIPEMEIALYVFADGRELILDYTSNTDSLLNAIDDISLTNIPGTDLYSAAIEGLNYWNDKYSLTDINQGFMLLFTDGRDLAGRRTLSDVLSVRGNKQVFTVGVELDPNDFDRNALEQIGNAGTFIDTDFQNLTTRFEQVKTRLELFSKSFYWLNYSSARRSINSTLAVRIKDNVNTGSDSEISTTFDASEFYSVPRDIIVNGSAENPSGISSITLPADSTIEVSIETVFSYDLEPFSFEFSNDDKLTISSKPDKPFVFNFSADGIDGDVIEVTVTDTAQKSLNLQKILMVTFTKPTSVSNEIEDIEIPNMFSLSQNYPNPFNPSTTIKFGLPEAAVVQLEIFNLLGQKVQTVLSDRKSAGFHTISFDASNLSSGMYIYRIQAGDFVQIKRMTLIK